MHHAHHLGTFFVDGDGVEVVDFDVAVGPHRVGHGACIFGELGGAQHAHVFDALDGLGRRVAAQVQAEFLVAEDGQAFFQAQLEPVAASDAVAAPVVEVLVAHHRLDIGEIGVCGGGLVGQHVLGVEDVQALVFHRAHVEVAGGDDHETLQVQRQVKAGFVPGNRGHQRMHGVLGLVEVAGAHKYLQQVVFAVARGDALLAAHQLAGHQRKQVAGLAERVFPLGKVAAIVQGALVHQVAVAQQHRVLGPVGAQYHGVSGHHIRAVQEVGDAAKALGLALGEKGVVADEQAHQLGVLDGRAGGEDLQIKRTVVDAGQVLQHQLAAFDLEGGALAVDQHARQVQLFAVQAQRLGGHVGVAAHAHLVEHAGLGRVQVKAQLHRVDPESRRGVIGPVDGCRLSFTVHGGSPKNSIAKVLRNCAQWR